MQASATVFFRRASDRILNNLVLMLVGWLVRDREFASIYQHRDSDSVVEDGVMSTQEDFSHGSCRIDSIASGGVPAHHFGVHAYEHRSGQSITHAAFAVFV